jgi:hypothetical protein
MRAKLLHDFTLVTDPFAFVRLGRAERTNFGGDLADLLLVDAVDVNLVGPLDGERDPLGRGVRDRMRIAELQVEAFAGLGGAIADALNLEALAVAFGDALDHVRDERPREPVRRTVHLRFAEPLDARASVFDENADLRNDVLLELALGALDAHDRVRHGDRDVVGDRDQEFTDA